MSDEENKKVRKITLGFILGWILGILFSIMGIALLFSQPLAGVLTLLLAAILLPPINKLIADKLKISISGGLKFAVVVVLLIVIGIVGSATDKSFSRAPTRGQEVFNVGEQIQLGRSILTVNKIEFSRGGYFTRPTQGNEWINLNISIENTGSSNQYVTTLGQMFVRDSNGNSYQVAVTNKVLANQGFGLDGNIIANSKRTGWVGFEINKGATGLQFQYQGSMFGGNTILVNLGR